MVEEVMSEAVVIIVEEVMNEVVEVIENRLKRTGIPC
jgi:hypothetical protein